MGTDETEGLELLGLALDGPRTGPIGEAIVTRLGRWWPGVTKWRSDLYAQLARWEATDELEVGLRLVALAHDSVNPRVTAAALDALSRGWPSVEGLDEWLHEAERSASIQLRTVGALTLYRRGRRDDERRDSLLDALGMPWSRFTDGLHPEIMDALVADWASDGEFQDACWAGVGTRGPPKYHIGYDIAQSMLMRIHAEDPRVPRWLQQQIETGDSLSFARTERGSALLEPIFSEHANVRAAAESWFDENKFSSHDFEAAHLAAMLRSDAAKRAMLSALADTEHYRFWPVWSLLHGWGIDDPEVAAVLEPLPRMPAEDRQHIAHHIPEIVGSVDDSFRLLAEICDLPEVSRTDFVIQGFAALGNEIDEGAAVSAILPHIRESRSIRLGESQLIARFHADPRVRAFALERLAQPSPPLEAMAGVYSADAEIAPLILQRAAPLPPPIREAGDHPPGRALPSAGPAHLGQAGYSDDHILSLVRSLSRL